MSRLFRISLLSLLVAGCAAPSLTYVEPTQGERSRVRFATGTSGLTTVRGYDDAGCRTNEKEWMKLIRGQNPLIESTPRRLGMPGWYQHENAAKEVYVEASKAHTLMFIGSETSGTNVYRCGVPLTFKFEKDRDYEVSFHLAPPNCSVTVLQLSTSQPVRTALQTFDNRISDETAVCLDQFKKMRWQ
jgi:hypothetical protein